MRMIIVTGLLCVVVVISGRTLAEGGQADSGWSTAVKITCDRTVAEGSAIGLMLCRTTACTDHSDNPVTLTCGTEVGMRSTGVRVYTPDFKPTVFLFTLKSGGETCTMGPIPLENMFGEVGSTILCNDARSLKLSVGRPH